MKFVHRGGDAAVLFGGRTIEIRVYVNTDESVEDVAERVLAAAKGPLQRMALAACGEVPRKEAIGLWLASGAKAQS